MVGHREERIRNPKGLKRGNGQLRVYRDIKCPNCGSNIYWGTHKCRRCGVDFPDNLVAEIDRRSMMHYIPIEYGDIARDRITSSVIIASQLGLLALIAIALLNLEGIVANIRITYVISWAFFICIITAAMLTIFYLTDPKNKVLNKPNLLFTLLLMGTAGLCIGFVTLIQVVISGASEFEVLVCAAYIVLSALTLAGARPIWPIIAVNQIIFIAVGTVLLTWPLMYTFVRSDWTYSFLHSAGSPSATIIITAVGIIALTAGTYSIFHGNSFNIRLNNCYPTWFAGMAFLGLFTFFRAALFRPELQITYLEALIFLIGIVLVVIGLMLFIRKRYTDNYIHRHLNRSNREFSIAERQYSKGDYSAALKRYEKLLVDNPSLVFGTTNAHPTLELLGIEFQHQPSKREVKKDKNQMKKNEEQAPEADIDSEKDEEDQNELETKTPEALSDIEAEEGEEEEEEDDPELRHAEATALLKKSTFYEKAGQRQKALSCIEHSIKLDRSRAETWIRLGHLTSKIGSSWDKIKGYYDWVVNLKLKAVADWVDSESVPSQYSLWLLEELSLLKKTLVNIGRANRTLKTNGTQRPPLVSMNKKIAMQKK